MDKHKARYTLEQIRVDKAWHTYLTARIAWEKAKIKAAVVANVVNTKRERNE